MGEESLEEGMGLLKGKSEGMGEIGNGVMKEVYEAEGEMYENMMIGISDGKGM